MNNDENNLLNKQPVDNNIGSETFNVPPANTGMNFENSTVETNSGINPETQNMGAMNNETVQGMPAFNGIPNQMDSQLSNMEPINNNPINLNGANVWQNNFEMNTSFQNAQPIETVVPGVSSVPPVTSEANSEVQNMGLPNQEISQNIPNVPPVVPFSEPTLGNGSSGRNNNTGKNKYVPLLVIGAVIIFLAIAYFTLFNTKTLECTMTDSETGMEMKQTMKVTFRKNSVTKLGMTSTVTLSDEYKDYMDLFKDTFEKQFESQFENYKDKKGVTMDTTTNDNVFTFKLEADLTKMDQKTKESLNMAGNSENYKTVKASLEADGYTCK